MNPDAILAWQFQPWLSAVAALLSALACHVALELNRRVGGASLRAALPWLAGAALTLGTALWSVHFLSLAERPLHLPVGYGGAVTLAAWVAAVLLGAGALLLAGARRWLRALAPGLLAITAVGVYAACLFDMRLAPAPIWQPLGLLAAVPALALLVAGAGWLASGTGRPIRAGGRRPLAWPGSAWCSPTTWWRGRCTCRKGPCR